MNAQLTRSNENRCRHPSPGGARSVREKLDSRFRGNDRCRRAWLFGCQLSTVDCQLFSGGEGGIRTHVPAFGRQDAFEAPPL